MTFARALLVAALSVLTFQSPAGARLTPKRSA
jgi:hypothetical protein